MAPGAVRNPRDGAWSVVDGLAAGPYTVRTQRPTGVMVVSEEDNGRQTGCEMDAVRSTGTQRDAEERQGNWRRKRKDLGHGCSRPLKSLEVIQERRGESFHRLNDAPRQ